MTNSPRLLPRDRQQWRDVSVALFLSFVVSLCLMSLSVGIALLL